VTDLAYVTIRIGHGLASSTAPVAEERQESSSKNTISAHGAPHHVWTPGTPPSKSGAESDPDSATVVATWFPTVLVKKKLKIDKKFW